MAEEHDPGPRRQALAAIVLIAVLVGVSLYLSGVLRGVGAIQDCVASGRTNCAPVG